VTESPEQIAARHLATARSLDPDLSAFDLWHAAANLADVAAVTLLVMGEPPTGDRLTWYRHARANALAGDLCRRHALQELRAATASEEAH
jgi:hypothetical protein